MSKQVGGVSWSQGQRDRASYERSAADASLRALELVATRGADVLGVRHVLDGGECWVGPAHSSIAKISMAEFGGAAAIVANVNEGRCTLHVPPRARARTHGKDGLGRLLMGPIDLDVTEDDRTVLVLGSVQIRARVVKIETAATVEPYRRREAMRWLIATGGLYVTALAICAMVAPGKPLKLQSGAMQRAVAVTFERAAEKARKQSSNP